MHYNRHQSNHNQKQPQTPKKQDETSSTNQLDSKQLIKLLVIALLNELNSMEDQEENGTERMQPRYDTNKEMQKKSPSHAMNQFSLNALMNNLDLNSLSSIANFIGPLSQLNDLNSNAQQHNELLLDESSNSEERNSKKQSENENKKDAKEKQVKKISITSKRNRRRRSANL